LRISCTFWPSEDEATVVSRNIGIRLSSDVVSHQMYKILTKTRIIFTHFSATLRGRISRNISFQRNEPLSVLLRRRPLLYFSWKLFTCIVYGTYKCSCCV